MGLPRVEKTRMHTYSSVFLHVVFGTAGHLPLLDSAIRPRAHAYLGGIARALQLEPLSIGGVEDHVHMLLRLSMTVAIGDVIGKIKGNSSKWMNDTFEGRPKFGWQRGYGAFSVSYSALSRVRRYIERQEEHHRTRSFADEVAELLRLHQMTFEIDDLRS